MYLRISFLLIMVGSVPLIAKGLYNIGFLIQEFSSPVNEKFWAMPIEDILWIIALLSLLFVIIPIVSGIINVTLYKKYPLVASSSALLVGGMVLSIYAISNNPLPEAILMGLSSLALTAGGIMTWADFIRIWKWF